MRMPCYLMMLILTSLTGVITPTICAAQGTPEDRVRLIIETGIQDIQNNLDAAFPGALDVDIRRGMLLIHVTGTSSGSNDGPRTAAFRQQPNGTFVVRGGNQKATFCDPFDPATHGKDCTTPMHEDAGAENTELLAVTEETVPQGSQYTLFGYQTPDPCTEVSRANMGWAHVQHCGPGSTVRTGYYYFTNANNLMFLFVPDSPNP